MVKAKLITYRDFSDSWGFFTKIACKAIQIWTRSKYFHTELYIQGVRITSDTRYGVIFKRTGIKWDYVKKYADVKTIILSEDNAKKVLEFAKTQENKKYDWRGIWFSQFLPLNKQDKNKWFCNEIVGESLRRGNVKEITKKSNQYNPGSFQKLF